MDYLNGLRDKLDKLAKKMTMSVPSMPKSTAVPRAPASAPKPSTGMPTMNMPKTDVPSPPSLPKMPMPNTTSVMPDVNAKGPYNFNPLAYFGNYQKPPGGNG